MRLSTWSLILVVLLAAACAAPSPLPPATRVAPTPAATNPLLDPFISPLASGEKPPIGILGLPGARDGEPTWPMISPDGRVLGLSQKQAEDIAIQEATRLLGAPASTLTIVDERLRHMIGEGRDLLLIQIAPVDSPEDAASFAVDAVDGAIYPLDPLQWADFGRPEYASPYGKLGRDLWAAMLEAHPTSRLHTIVALQAPSAGEIDAAFLRIYPEFAHLLEVFGSFVEAISYDTNFETLMDVHNRLETTMRVERTRPVLDLLDQEGILYQSSGQNPSTLYANLTSEQIIWLARHPDVLSMAYYGGADPNTEMAVPTPLSPGASTIPFTTLIADDDGIGLDERWAGLYVHFIDSARNLTGLPPLPDKAAAALQRVDFTKNVAILAYRGIEAAGFPTRIADIVHGVEGDAIVYVDLWSEHNYGIEGGVPYHIVLVDKDDLFYMGDGPNLVVRTTERSGSPWPPR